MAIYQSAKNILKRVKDEEVLEKIKNVDGDGSGLDADMLDGHEASDFAATNHSHDSSYVKLSDYEDIDILNKLKNVDGDGSGLDADLLRGLPADFTCSKNQNGYTKLPNGLIIQWGTSSSISVAETGKFTVSVTFPITFPTVCIGIATVLHSGDVDNGSYFSARHYVGAPSLTGFTGVIEKLETYGSFGIYYIVIGY